MACVVLWNGNGVYVTFANGNALPAQLVAFVRAAGMIESFLKMRGERVFFLRCHRHPVVEPQQRTAVRRQLFIITLNYGCILCACAQGSRQGCIFVLGLYHLPWPPASLEGISVERGVLSFSEAAGAGHPHSRPEPRGAGGAEAVQEEAAAAA